MGVSCGKVFFAVEQFCDAYDEARPLLRLHWEEIAKNKNLLTINPDETLYEKAGNNLLLITARLEGHPPGRLFSMVPNQAPALQARFGGRGGFAFSAA